MLAGVTITDPARPSSTSTCGSARTRRSSRTAFFAARSRSASGAAFGPVTDVIDCWSATGQRPPLLPRRLRGAGRMHCRALYSHPAGDRLHERAEGGRLRRDQELPHRRGREGSPPLLYRRCRHRRRRQHRRRNITANYDGHGQAPHRDRPGCTDGRPHSFVAPVTVGEGAYTGAGSVITEDVPPGALGIARSRQTNVEGYADTQSEQPKRRRKEENRE